jgi:trehalose/maltose transport system substrate-binding protein
MPQLQSIVKVLMCLALVATELPTDAATLTIACGSGGTELELCKRHADEWAQRTGNTVNTFSQPASAMDALTLYRQLFAAKSPAVDVVRIDTVWPSIIRDHLLDLRPYSKGAEKEHFPVVVANHTVNGRLVAMPWYVDAGLLYYRKDLLAKHGMAVPRTWHELTEVAAKIQALQRASGERDFHGYVFQGKAYEGLTCNVVEWVASFGGGALVESDGRITANNPQFAKAMDLAASWVGTISPRGVLNYEEEDARGVFQNGNALFMRSWPYAWKLVEAKDSKVKGKVGVALLPAGDESGRQVATLGGWHLAVSRYSRHPDLAADLVMYMTSSEVQKQRAITGAFNPTRPALYTDPDIVAANPFMSSLAQVFDHAVLRPSSPTGMKYPAVSKAISDQASEVLAGNATGTDAARRLEGKLYQIRRTGWGVTNAGKAQ